MNDKIIELVNEIKEGTNRYNRTPRNKWFSERFTTLKELLPFEVSTFSEINYIITNNLSTYPTCELHRPEGRCF